MNLLGLIFLPIRLIFNVLFVFELNFLLGLVGFLLGLIFGLVAGYFAFIYSIPLTVEEPVIPKLSEGDGSVDRKVLKHVTPEMPIWVRNPDYDRVDWINRFVTELWPHLDKAVGSLVTAQVTPLIEQYKPKQIESIEFESLSLGTLPPAITGVKVYDTTDDEVILEPILKWAGNPNVIVAAKAFGLKATVQLVDLTVFATLRITMKPLVPVFPCFSRMTVSLMHKPTIDFGLKLLGGDLMAIPGLYNFAQETIKDVLCNMMLWPKSYEVYKEEDPTSLKRSVGKLFVRNIRCRNLKDNQRLGTSDPYVYGTMGDKLGNKHTEVQENNLNPDFSEELHLLVRDPAVQSMQLHVMHKNKKKQDLDMGVVTVPIKELKEHELKEFTLDITTTSTDTNAKQVANSADNTPATPPGENLGTMYFELMYRPFEPNEEGSLDTPTPAEETFPPDIPIGGGKLKVTVHNGEALAGKSTPNPYVKVQFRGEERKTHVVKKERDPDFEDPPFEFYSKTPPSRDTLHVFVFSKTSGLHHYVSSKESLGYVDIPLGDVVSNGRINDVYQLTESRSGRLKIEIEWIEKKPGKEVPPTPEAMQQQQQQQQQQQMGADAATQQQQQPNAPPQQQAAPPPPQHPAPPPPMQQQQQAQQYNAGPAAGGPPGFQQQGMGGPTVNVTSELNRQPFANPTAQLPTSQGNVPPQSSPKSPKSPRGFLGFGHHHHKSHRK